MFSKKEEFPSGAFNKYHAQVYLTVNITIQVPLNPYQYTCDMAISASQSIKKSQLGDEFLYF